MSQSYILVVETDAQQGVRYFGPYRLRERAEREADWLRRNGFAEWAIALVPLEPGVLLPTVLVDA